MNTNIFNYKTLIFKDKIRIFKNINIVASLDHLCTPYIKTAL